MLAVMRGSGAVKSDCENWKQCYQPIDKNKTLILRDELERVVSACAGLIHEDNNLLGLLSNVDATWIHPQQTLP